MGPSAAEAPAEAVRRGSRQSPLRRVVVAGRVRLWQGACSVRRARNTPTRHVARCGSPSAGMRKDELASQLPSLPKSRFARVLASSEPQGWHVGPQQYHPAWDSMRIVTYVGTSPLPQLPWPTPRHEPVLLVSLFDGIGGALVASMALGMNFAAVCIEHDPEAVQVVQGCFRHVMHWPDVTKFDVSLLQPALQSGRFCTVVVIGSPCQQASQQKGLDADASQFLEYVPRVSRDIRRLIKRLCMSIPVLSILEHVEHASAAFAAAASNAMQGPPIIVHGGSFGWVPRSACFWVTDGHTGVHALDHLPIPRCTSVHRDSKGRWTVSWKHKKPFPETAPGGGYKDQFESEAIAPPSARERAFLMGFPPDMVCTRACDQTESRRKLENKRCSLLENASHVPSVMVVMSLAHALLPPPEPIPRPIYAAFEARLRGAAQGTVWQPGLLDSWPGVLSSAALLAHVRQSFSELNVALPDLHTSNDMDLALRRLQVYWVDSQIRGRQAFDQGPCWAQQKARAASAVSLGVQKGGPTSKHAPEPLLPTGLSKETHVQLSSCLPFPFESEVVLDDDMSFAVKGMYVLGPCIRAWRRQQRRALETLAKWLQPWDVELRKHMCPAVAAVAANKSPALIAALTALLRWPDVALASRFVTGFALLGDVEVPHIFRPLDVDRKPPESQLGLQAKLGQEAEESNCRVARALKETEHSSFLTEFTRKEIAEGIARGPFTKQELDAQYGRGAWLAMPRFAHVQGCGKVRPIDNGKAAGHNSFSWSDETIYTSSPDAVAGAARKFAKLMESEGMPPWCQLVFGSDDMSSAYRQVPNCPDEAQGLVVAWWDVQVGGVLYAVLNGHPYGLATAVVNFCRIPALTTAVCRRLLAIAAVSYFDDTGTLDTVAAAGSGQEGVALVHSLCGFRLDPGKQQPMAVQRLFLGVLLDFSQMRENGLMSIDLKPGAREQLAAEANALLELGVCSPAQAAKLRGKFSWSSSAVFGRIGRGGQGALVDRQYKESDCGITPVLERSLKFLAALTQWVPARTIPLLSLPRRPAIVYTDASWQPELGAAPGLGGVLFMPGAQTKGFATTVPQEVIQAFLPRETQISPLEALAVLQMTLLFQQDLANRDVIWWVDNTSVCSGLIKGASTASDLAQLTLVINLLWASMGCRVYVDYVPSDSNVADGLSRDGMQDSWTQAQQWGLQQAHCVPWHLYSKDPLHFVPVRLFRWSSS